MNAEQRPDHIPTSARLLRDDGGTWEDGATEGGNKVGLWRWWSRAGVLVSEADYKEGVLKQIRRFYETGELYEKSTVIAGKLKHRTWFIDPSQPFADLIGNQIMLKLSALPTSVRQIKKLPGYPISYDCFNSRGVALDKHGFPRDDEAKQEFQATAKKMRSKRKLASKEAALSRVDEFLAFMSDWDFIIPDDAVEALRRSIETTPADDLGVIVAEFARDAMKKLKDRKW